MGSGYWRAIEPFWERLSSFESPEAYAAGCTGIPQPIVFLHATHWVQSEVCNGGFGQLFDNSTGVLVPEAVSGFAEIGMRRCASLVGCAMGELGASYPRERTERQKRLWCLASEVFSLLEDDFLDMLEIERGGFGSAADSYAERMIA